MRAAVPFLQGANLWTQIREMKDKAGLKRAVILGLRKPWRSLRALGFLITRDPCILYEPEKTLKIHGSRILSFCNAFAAQKTNKS
jgi:hypothetical protein